MPAMLLGMDYTGGGKTLPCCHSEIAVRLPMIGGNSGRGRVARTCFLGPRLFLFHRGRAADLKNRRYTCSSGPSGTATSGQRGGDDVKFSCDQPHESFTANSSRRAASRPHGCCRFAGGLHLQRFAGGIVARGGGAARWSRGPSGRARGVSGDAGVSVGCGAVGNLAGRWRCRPASAQLAKV